MDKLFRTKSRLWQAIQSNLLFIGIVELLIYNVGLTIKYQVQALFNPFTALVGEEFTLYYNANFWIVCGIHTGWNYVQSYLFSTSNSGDPYSIGLFLGTVDNSTAFYEKTYGYEGALSTTVLMTVVIGILIYRLYKKGQLKSTMSVLPADDPADVTAVEA